MLNVQKIVLIKKKFYGNESYNSNGEHGNGEFVIRKEQKSIEFTNQQLTIKLQLN